MSALDDFDPDEEKNAYMEMRLDDDEDNHDDLRQKTTSNISNEFEEKIRNRLYALWGNLDVDSGEFDFISRSVFKLVAAYIQQEKSALLNELLEQKIYYISGGHEAVPVSVIEAKSKDLNQGGEDV